MSTAYKTKHADVHSNADTTATKACELNTKRREQNVNSCIETQDSVPRLVYPAAGTFTLVVQVKLQPLRYYMYIYNTPGSKTKAHNTLINARRYHKRRRQHYQVHTYTQIT